MGIGGNADWDPNDIGIQVGEGESCLYAGADAGGRNATQWQDTRAASNNFVTALDIGVSGANDDRLALFGEHECEWIVLNPDGSLRGTLEMRRGTTGGTASPATTADHQRHPAALTAQPNVGIFAGVNPIPTGTRFISNMKSFLVANYHETLESWANEDEVTVFGSVIPSYLCQTRTRQDGLLERLVLDEVTGNSNWVSA